MYLHSRSISEGSLPISAQMAGLTTATTGLLDQRGIQCSSATCCGISSPISELSVLVISFLAA